MDLPMTTGVLWGATAVYYTW